MRINWWYALHLRLFFLSLQNRRMKAKKDGKIKNMMDGMPDSGGIVPGMGHPDSSGKFPK